MIVEKNLINLSNAIYSEAKIYFKVVKTNFKVIS
jgi:hypothetical protein